MDLIIYDQPGRMVSTCPTISFNKTGGITFGKALVELMDLKDRDQIAFAQDANEKIDWYVYKASQGFTIRPSRSGSMRFNSLEMVTRIYTQFKVESGVGPFKNTVQLKIGKEAVNHKGLKLYPIITAPLAKIAKEKKLKALTS